MSLFEKLDLLAERDALRARVAELESERDTRLSQIAALREENNLLTCIIRELRTINVEPGISLGKAHDWKARVAELESALKLLIE